MAAMTQKTSFLILSVALCGLLTMTNAPVHADSTVIDGPGFKIEKKKGWFGRQSTTYHDALGNEVEKKTGWFGRKTTSTKLFGSQAVQNGNNLTVNGPNGKPLITRKKTLFGGKQTHVDGNGIFQSVKDLFK
jgi:hypothetical protein